MMEQEEIAEELNRDGLALVRTRLANERTMLAYTRTAIMLAATGVTLLLLESNEFLSAVSGWLLVAAAIGVGVVGASRFYVLARRIT